MQPLNPLDWSKFVRPGSRVFIGSGAGVPQALVDSLLAQKDHLQDVELVHIHTLGETPWIRPEFDGVFRTNTFFLTPEVAEAVRLGRADYTPCSLSEVGRLFESTALPLDVALVSVAPGDEHGRHSLGVSVDVCAAAVRSASVVVAQINAQMPASRGSEGLDASQIDYFLEVDAALPEWRVEDAQEDRVRQKIGGYLAELVENGSTLQVGMGATPQRAIQALRGHRRLGIHTGMLGDGLRELLECGAVDNSRKGFQEGLSVASHALGTRELYQFVRRQRQLLLRASEWVNDPVVIARNQRMTAINGALQIDLTGQIVRDSSGHSFHGGVGAQLDFLRGAAASPGGRPICVMPATSGDGRQSRIVADFASGTQVATARSDTHWVITEFGIANLHGRSIRERALAMIGIAHPDHREELLRGAHSRGWLPPVVATPPTSLRPGEGVNDLEVQRLSFPRLDVDSPEGADAEEPPRFLLRPLHPPDMRRLQRFFYSHSEETIRLRYGYRRDAMPEKLAYGLVSVDQSRDLALGLFEETGSANEEVIRAIGRFYRDDPAGDGSEAPGAEVAFVVGETMRRRGVGSRLLVEMARIAQARGIRQFWAEVLHENRGMAALFARFGGQRRASREIEGWHITMEVAEILRQAQPDPVTEVTEGEEVRRLSEGFPPASPNRPDADGGASSSLVAPRQSVPVSDEETGFSTRSTTGWFWDAQLLAHDTGPGHPEGTERYRQVGDGLEKLAKELGMRRLAGREASREELLRVHAAHYLDLVHIDVEGLADTLRTGDTAICAESERVARLATGAGLAAVDAVLTGEVARAFVAVRPPGHHATAERGMGFCLYNHVAVMARHAQQVYGVERVLIVDWDVHHGNGTQDIFYDDPSVWYFSSHQQGLFPATGAREERGGPHAPDTVFNLLLPAGSDAQPVLEALRGPVMAAMEAFQPQLVLISAGFDARHGDLLGSLNFSDADFADLTRVVLEIADRWANGRLVSLLEGGYDPPGLRQAVCAHVRALAERE